MRTCEKKPKQIFSVYYIFHFYKESIIMLAEVSHNEKIHLIQKCDATQHKKQNMKKDGAVQCFSMTWYDIL